MFGWRKKKIQELTITPEDKIWVEESLAWMIETFGYEHLERKPFLFPVYDEFPYKDVNDKEQFDLLFDQLCRHFRLNREEIHLKLFDDIQSKQWTTYVPQGEIKEAAGMFIADPSNGKPFTVEIAQSNLNNVYLLVTVMAHELAHVKTIGGGHIAKDSHDLEVLTDLTSIFFGFGIFMANSFILEEGYWLKKTGYLPPPVIAYTNALLCYISGKGKDEALPMLNQNTRELFEGDFEYLTQTRDTLLTPLKIEESKRLHDLGKQNEAAFASRDLAKAVEANLQILKIRPKNATTYNNLGYARLLQKDYRQAIKDFTSAIELDPYFDYPFNNRGYCHLQLGDLESARTDLQASFEMNPSNSYSWRNLGAYFLKEQNPGRALEYLEEAFRLDPATELIHYYLALAYRMLGENEKAEQFMHLSRQLNEYNDSTNKA